MKRKKRFRRNMLRFFFILGFFCSFKNMYGVFFFFFFFGGHKTSSSLSNLVQFYREKRSNRTDVMSVGGKKTKQKKLSLHCLANPIKKMSSSDTRKGVSY